jgi:ABC-type multidrug transport system ATPase subunit
LATSAALSLRNIDAYYSDSHVLQDVSFELGEARMLGLLGRNGAGKSTCMHVAMGLLPPRHGEVLVFGTPDIQEPDGARKPGGGRAQAGQWQTCALDNRNDIRDVPAFA